jgi:hypothetical protein
MKGGPKPSNRSSENKFSVLVQSVWVKPIGKIKKTELIDDFITLVYEVREPCQVTFCINN